MSKSVLASLVDENKLGGWVRAGVASGLSILIAKWQPLGSILDPATQTALGVVVSGIVVGVWSHYVKS